MRKIFLLILAAGLLTSTCEDTLEPQDVLYTVEVSGEEFHVMVTDAQAIARMEDRLRTGEEGVILGRVAIGNEGFNAPWSWHLVPSTVEVPDLSIELCDGRPSMVEADLTNWIAQVQNYCPWGAKVIARTNVAAD